MTKPELPVAVIGAGPVGLAAAAHLSSRGQTPVILEAGERVGAAVRRWGHVRVFSPWRYNVDPTAVRMLGEVGWRMPDPERLPTGQDLVTRYLEPLAALPGIREQLRLGRRVVSVSRRGLDKLRTDGRDATPFVLRMRSAAGEEEILARAVIDASGTYDSPNPLGADGTPAHGEAGLGHRVFYAIPDVLGVDRRRYGGRRVAVVGSGHSAFNTLLDLAELARTAPGTRVSWLVRRPPSARVFGGGAGDALPARGALGQEVRRLLDGGSIALVVGRVARLTGTTGEVTILDDAGSILAQVDEVIGVTGFRPDLAPLRELRLDLDPALEAPRALAPLIDPNVHSCGTVPPHGVGELAQPEPGFYVVGMKSYGRAPTFLLVTGYEQVRSVVAALAGDWEAARDVRLTLPETGVCSAPRDSSAASRSVFALASAGSCCGGPAPDQADACCAQDAEAKTAGHDGCGCQSTMGEAPEAVPTAASRPKAEITSRPATLVTIGAPAPPSGCCLP